jgi:branched-subunit amino acid transport protein
MEKHSIILYILLGILVTNLIRVLPMVLIKGQIRNRFVRSFLYYVPYVTLAVMTFPDIIHTTMTPVSGVVALIVGIVAAWFRFGLFPVAAICCAVTYLIEHFI